MRALYHSTWAKNGCPYLGVGMCMHIETRADQAVFFALGEVFVYARLGSICSFLWVSGLQNCRLFPTELSSFSYRIVVFFLQNCRTFPTDKRRGIGYAMGREVAPQNTVEYPQRR
jgi:hypothetical protein